MEPYLVMFVKDALQKEVGVVIGLSGAVWRNFQPEHKGKYQKRAVTFYTQEVQSSSKKYKT